ncbi:MAG: hypothetical protein LLG01_12845 [Planctomycetaceae bacterium]|nr:hypothetical protein [Planctomycetaceae bacterium]
MNPRHRTTAPQSHGLAAELLRDKKKTAILSVLLVVGVIMGVRLIGKSEPVAAQAAVAVAAPAAGVTAPQAEEVIKSIAARKTNPNQVRVFKRDLFRVHEDLYTLLSSPAAQAAPVAPAAGPIVDPELETKRRIERVQLEAKLLCLQITIVSDNPTAIINGDPFGIGDTITTLVKERDGKETKAEFKVVSIAAKVCTIVRDGVSVELRMKDEKP